MGLKWNVESDLLEISRGAKNEIPSVVTQRALLSHVSAVFDSLGLFAPYAMRVRIFLQTVWMQTGQEWDEPLQHEDVVIFDAWAEELKIVKEFFVQRQYFANCCPNYEKHVIADASLETMCMTLKPK